MNDVDDWTARRLPFPRPCKGDIHVFAPIHQGRFKRDGRLRELVAWDTCTCGAKRWSQPMAWVASAYAEAATS